jgi:hypothetical protein
LQCPVYLVFGDMNDAYFGTQPKPFAPGVRDSGNVPGEIQSDRLYEVKAALLDQK